MLHACSDDNSGEYVGPARLQGCLSLQVSYEYQGCEVASGGANNSTHMLCGPAFVGCGPLQPAPWCATSWSCMELKQQPLTARCSGQATRSCCLRQQARMPSCITCQNPQQSGGHLSSPFLQPLGVSIQLLVLDCRSALAWARSKQQPNQRARDVGHKGRCGTRVT
jgi:hypothetical protein